MSEHKMLSEELNTFLARTAKISKIDKDAEKVKLPEETFDARMLEQERADRLLDDEAHPHRK